MPRFTSRNLGCLCVIALATTALWAAETTRPTTTSSSQKSAPGKGSAKGVLPDPALLDGSAHPAEKRPEYGMVGDFELPGDENVRNNRVGGQQQPPPQGGGGPQVSVPTPGLPIPAMPSGGGVPGISVPQLPNPLGQQGQGQPGGPQDPNASGQQAQGGQQIPQAQGAQVGQLSGEGGGPEQGQIGEKPPDVSIGDSAMQIKTVANAGTVVGGAQPAGKTQQHEKTPGSGGKGAQGNNSNKGVERGRAIPSGL